MGPRRNQTPCKLLESITPTEDPKKVLSFIRPGTSDIPVPHKRKTDRNKKQNKKHLRHLINLQQIHPNLYIDIQLDKDINPL
jgi:hypothetical protein